MNRHQVLTGACNSGEQCYAVGSVEGIHFTAYAAGCNIVILASNFERVQIIPGVSHGNIKVSCIDCSTDTGKIAASYGRKVHIFEPTPLIHESQHKLDYRWYKTATIETECFVNCLSWNMEGSKLLTGGEVIQIWQMSHRDPSEEDASSKRVQFSVGPSGGEDDDPIHTHFSHVMHPEKERSFEPHVTEWDSVWKCKPSSAVFHLKFSPDGYVFASAGKADRLVKIWYEDRKLSPQLIRSDSISPKVEEQHYSFVYISHPRAVTGFSWRKTSKFMPRGSVANMLVTSCLDNVCRIWCETILPDDGLLDLEQFDPSGQLDPKFHTHRHKKRFLQRLKTIRHAIHKRKKHPKYGPDTVMSMTSLPSMGSVHDFHKFAIHHNGVSPVLHFHLAGSINPETDIPLQPIIGNKGDVDHNFKIHWLNNKELQFTIEAEHILQDLHKQMLFEESHKEEVHTSHEFDSEEHEHEHDHEDDHDDQEADKDETGHGKKKRNKFFKRRHKHKNFHKDNKSLGSHTDSMSSMSSEEGTGSSTDISSSIVESLDRKIEVLLRDWHQSSDMLFSIHPVDGSFLVWLVDWLDECNPYCFRQAQVSFSSRLPNAFPIPDARTMASNVLMYCNYSKMDIKSAMKMSESKVSMMEHEGFVRHSGQPATATGKNSPGQNDNMLIPNVLMISKHSNGSINQWQISFSDNSKFQTIVSVAHASRACGHRFRTNSASCHPVLPLLLTTSHHNIPEEESPEKDSATDDDGESHGGFSFCSELILWRVDPVGPLSKSGGIVELARINAPPISAFSNVAWVPTLLPSTSLGSYSNSPSALFVASDGNCLRLYQAVIDARTLLMDASVQRKDQALSFSSTTSSSYHGDTGSPVRAASEVFNIVSQQSSARPGCIMELQGINDAQQDWQNIQLLHVFQEQLVTGRFSSGDLGGPNMEAIVDLRNMSSFEENFYLVVLERNVSGGSMLHMWKITISSQLNSQSEGNRCNANPVGDYVRHEFDVNSPFRGASFDEPDLIRQASVMTMSITTTKVCNQMLMLPEDVQVLCVNVAAGHLSSASIYPACFAPYLLVTACSDGDVRFWKCDVTEASQSASPTQHKESFLSITSYEYSLEEEARPRRPAVMTRVCSQPYDTDYTWSEWEMMNTCHSDSAITIPGKPITVCCAYSGRIAVAYRHGAIRAMSENPHDKFVNLYVAIYECESTGGSEWVLEDTIELKNIKIPDPKAEIDLAQIFNPDGSASKPVGGLSPSSSFANIPRTKSVPSLSTIHTVRKSIAEQGNKLGLLMQKCLVQLDWVSAEDGSHILTVGVGSKVLMYSQVSNEISQESLKAFTGKQLKSTSSTLTARSRPMMQKSKSLVVDNYQEEIRWMRLRALELTTADGLPPLPMHLSWVRAGILVLGMDNEMHVYSQWRGASGADNQSLSGDDVNIDKRTLNEVNRSCVASSSNFGKKPSTSFKPSYSMPSFKHFNSSLSHNSFKRKEMWKKSEQGSAASKNSLSRSDSITSLSVIHDFGLFEAARQANPVLPQYHPKQLIELLNFGKIKRVKAILAHLARCMAGSETMQAVYVDDLDNEEGLVSVRSIRPRSVSVSASNKESELRLEEEITVDVNEISSIPPLPIYALLAADEDNTGVNVEISKAGAATAPNTNPHPEDYTELFSRDVMNDDSLDEALLSTSADSSGTKRTRMHSSSHTAMNPHYFGPKQGKVLGAHLLHIRLPGLSSLDQMYLMALADTVASTKVDISENFSHDQPKTGMGEGQADISHATESMDDCGVRFLLAMRHHNYLLGTLPPLQKLALQRQGLKSFQLVWAFHSEATEELLSFIPSMQKGEPTWEELKQYGAGWWITNISQLKKCIEKVAKAAFQAKKNPLDAALFFLAMKKKNVLWGLYRSVSDKKMQMFFKNDFTQDRWRKAALKNAFALLGRQMFQEAAAFFLLAGSLKDAIEVCLEKLHDIQLALVISHLYDGEDMMPDSAKKIIYENILGCDEQGMSCDSLKAHPDPFLRSMSLWMLKDYKGALQTLMEVNIGRPQMDHEQFDLDSSSVTPNVFNFYNYLRTHPLLLRQRLACASLGRRKTVMTGFTRAESVAVQDNSITTIDRVTPTERRLFFSTAHAHFKNGCPLMALEVLSRLPPMVEDAEEGKKMYSLDKHRNPSNVSCISTGTLSELDESNTGMNDWSTPVSGNLKNMNKDMNGPLTNGKSDTADNMDWGTPVTFSVGNGKADMDWGTPSFGVRFDDDLDRELAMIGHASEEEEEEEEYIEPKSVFSKSENVTKSETNDSSVPAESTPQKLDIMAQQYKFIACLKVLMEELGTLATGFEVDGGQLRYQLYIWLEKEAEVLRVLCNYGQQEEELPETNLDASRDSDEFLDVPKFGRSLSVKSDTSASKASLHEVILADKLDLEAKMERMARRKQWLKNNQQLLRTLLSYCVLQGSGGGGLASVRMELLLLLQELQQEKPQQQLLSPLPFPSTLPLLSASIASSKTVVADPIHYLQCLSQDILHTIIEIPIPPNLATDVGNVFLLRNLAVALSSCIYQCLCDSDSFVVSLNDEDVGLEGFTGPNFVCQASYLMAGVRRQRHRGCGSGDAVINSQPAKWPGVTSLRVLLAREKDEDAPKLNILLCESLLSVYVSMLINGLATYDPLMLYRLAAHVFDQQTWSALFGGGVKTVMRSSNNPPNHSSADDNAKQRHRLNMKLIGPSPGFTKPSDVRETFQERFLPPELSMITYFMTKPFVPSSESIISYDSEDSMLSDVSEQCDTEDEDELDRPNTLNLTTVQQHSDPNSYTWCLIRYATIHLVLHNLQLFLPQIGIELPDCSCQNHYYVELPNCSPLLHAVMKTLEQWDEFLLGRLELFSGPPDNYIPGLYLDVVGGVPSSKVQALLDPANTPFVAGQATLPMKRLWFQLVRQDYLKDIFLRYIYRKKKNIVDSEVDSMRTTSTEQNDTLRAPDPMKIIHKEQDIITAFANNQSSSGWAIYPGIGGTTRNSLTLANLNCITLSTQKEIVELDIGAILHPPTWLEDETEYDIECIRNPHPTPSDVPDFLVVQTPQDGPMLPQSGSQTPSTPYYPSTPGSMSIGTPQAQTGRGSSVVKGLHFPGMHNPAFSQFVLDRSKRLIRVILRRQVVGVRRMGSHPHLPHYLSGSADGSVRLWEWGHAQPLTVLRQQGSFPKVTKVLFNAQGNKCCVSDIEGSICLWQVGLGSNFNKPIMSLSCHNKTTSDFTFVGSSSLIATAGHSSESKNVCLWDTLLPQRSALVHAFTCHEHGSPAVVYAPQHQMLISGGRKGEICIFDMRQRQMRHTFQAHDGPIKCLAMDSEEEYFVTGSAEGDVKVWGLDIHQLLFSFPGEHSKSTFFKNVGSTSGVAQVSLGPGHHLFSCGVDGSMKFRQLPEKDIVVQTWPS
ncbi:dmX-like protein 2 isoform X1 [Haliotis cracherodii]|uniref:dmX-like protein 2 isoform X1 n=1 Tax=Haliotis cracherodii TaxID=6455 RepID=UPI0039ECBF0A